MIDSKIKKAPIVIVSHRRSGTHWLIDSLRGNFKGVSSWYYNLDNIRYDDKFFAEIKKKLSDSSKHLILKSHTEADLNFFPPEKRFFVDYLLKRAKVIYVYRDGRDVLVSLYHYDKYKSEHRIGSFSSFIKKENPERGENRIEYWKRHIEGWLNRNESNILRISYEQIHKDYEGVLEQIRSFLGISFKKNKITKVSLRRYGLFLRALRKIFPGIFKSSAVFPRKGSIGEWKEYFSNEDLETFNLIAKDTMRKLGYY